MSRDTRNLLIASGAGLALICLFWLALQLPQRVLSAVVLVIGLVGLVGTFRKGRQGKAGG